MFGHRLSLTPAPIVACVALHVVACAVDEPPENPDFSDLEGIYEITDYQQNAESCEGSGEDRLQDTDTRFLVAAEQRFFGAVLLTVGSCATLTDCDELVEDLTRAGQVTISFGDLDYTFDRREDDQAVGYVISSGFGIDGVCERGEVTERVMVSANEDEILIEERTYIANDYAPNGDGACTSDAAFENAVDSPCASLSTVRAQFVEALPATVTE